MPYVKRKYARAKIVKFMNEYHRNNYGKNNIAYLAGLIDGEGYFKLEKWGLARIIIGMCDKEVILWCQKYFGGTVNLDQHTSTGKAFYIWRLDSQFEVLKLSILLYPFLVMRRKRKLVLKFIQNLLTTLKVKGKGMHSLTKWRTQIGE